MSSSSLRVAFVGCSKTKLQRTRGGLYIPARELYVGDLFKKRVEHVESRGLDWYVLSGKCGLISPTTAVRPYDELVTKKASDIEVAEWHLGVANQFMTELYYKYNSPSLHSVTVEIHAGSGYCEPLATILSIFGVNVIRPVANLGIGRQLAYYANFKKQLTRNFGPINCSMTREV